MPHTGLAYLHAGERVTPPGRSGEMQVTINIQAMDGASVERVTREKVIPILKRSLRSNFGSLRTEVGTSLRGR